MIERTLIDLANRWPAWAVAVLLAVAALSFLARHRAQYKYGRIREYDASSLGVAAVLFGLALMYLFVATGHLGLTGRPFVARLLLSLLGAMVTIFNWGGVRVAIRDFRAALGGRAG